MLSQFFQTFTTGMWVLESLGLDVACGSILSGKHSFWLTSTLHVSYSLRCGYWGTSCTTLLFFVVGQA